MQIEQYFLLGIILFCNSIIEFLPISSTAHSVLLYRYLNPDFIDLNILLSVAQLAITLSVCFYFRYKIIDIIKTFFFNKQTRIFCYKVLLTCIPTMLFGAIFHKALKGFYSSNIAIAMFLFLGGIVMLFIENSKKYRDDIKTIEDIVVKRGGKIGLFQMFSLLAGVSRSATTICSAIFLGIKKNLAIEYSFFISIPISFAASCFDLYSNINFLTNKNNFSCIIFTFIISLIFSLFFMKRLFKILNEYNLKLFGYYRIIISLLIMLLLI